MVLLGIALIISLVVFAACTAGGGDDKQNAASAISASPSSARTAAATIDPGATPPAPGALPPAPGAAGGTTGQPGGAAGGNNPPQPGGAAGGNPGDNGGASAGVAGTPGAVAGGGGSGCSLRVQLRGDRAANPRYEYGEQVNLQLVITNVGTDTCTVDLGRRQTAIDVTSGSDRIYSSADCATAAPEPNNIQPGKSVTRDFSWTWKRTDPSACTGTGPTLAQPTHNASYVAVGRVGGVASGPYVMVVK